MLPKELCTWTKASLEMSKSGNKQDHCLLSPRSDIKSSAPEDRDKAEVSGCDIWLLTSFGKAMWLNGNKEPNFVDHEGLRVEDLVNQPELSVQPKIKVSFKDI